MKPTKRRRKKKNYILMTLTALCAILLLCLVLVLSRSLTGSDSLADPGASAVNGGSGNAYNSGDGGSSANSGGSDIGGNSANSGDSGDGGSAAGSGTAAGSAVSESTGLSQQVIVRFDTVSHLFYDPAEQASAILSYLCEIPYVVIDSNPEAAAKINSALESYHAAYFTEGEGVSSSVDNETYLLSLAEDYFTARYGSGAAGGSSFAGAWNAASTTDYLFTFSHRSYVSRCDDSVIVFTFSDYTKTPENAENGTDNGTQTGTENGTQTEEENRANTRTETRTEVLAFNARTGDSIDLTRTDLFSTALYPLPEQCSGGSFRVDPAEKVAEDSAAASENVIDLLETDPEGIDYYFRVSGELYDVRFSSVVYYDRCYEKEQLWYCNVMRNESLQLKMALPGETPELKISFASPASGGESSGFVFAVDSGTGLLTMKDPDDLSITEIMTG